MKVNLGKVGLWSMELRFGDAAAGIVAAKELEALGYGALWIPGGIDDAVLGDVDRLLSATTRLAIGTGIINMWKQQPEDVAAWWKGQSPDRQARVMLGLGVSHAPLIGETWGKPVAVARDFVTRAAAAGLPADAMCLAALGPKMLELAGQLTAGAHPYLVTAEHSAIARKVMGPGKLVAPEQGVILETDPARAREAGLGALTHYRNLPNYRNNWLRLGFTEEDVETVSDALFDGLFAWGTADKIAERVKQHHDAGADHVCMQVIQGSDGTGIDGAMDVCRTLAKVLF